MSLAPDKLKMCINIKTNRYFIQLRADMYQKKIQLRAERLLFIEKMICVIRALNIITGKSLCLLKQVRQNLAIMFMCSAQ